MPQQHQAFAHRGEIQHIIPKASTDVSSGDYVVMPRNIDPISRARLGAESAVSPITANWDAQWGVGVFDSDFNTNTHGATKYAAPTASEALPVIRKGVVKFAITNTSGKAGDLVIYSSGASGFQLFTLNNFRRDIAVGRVYKDFSGATANDAQLVELIEKPISEKDAYFWLSNRVLEGCALKKHSANGQASSQINAGATGEDNRFMVKGKLNSLARVTDLTVGSINPGGQSAVRFFWIAAKVSTTGGAPAFTIETCTGPHSAFASWTNSGISAGMFIPITWTSNMIPIGLLIGWSTTQVSIAADRILQLGSPGLPNGTRVVDHTTWYL